MAGVKKIIIVGSNSEALIAAAILAVNLESVEIELIGTKNNTIMSLGGSVSVNFSALLELIGIDFKKFFVNTQAIYKLANYFPKWNDEHRQFYHSFGVYGTRILGAEFSQVAIKLKKNKKHLYYDAFSVAAAAAKAEKFFFSDDYLSENLPPLSYGINFDAHIFMRFLSLYHLQLGVKRNDALFSTSVLAPDGAVDHVIDASGKKHFADFYIDCSGKEALIIGQVLKVGWQSYSPWIKMDRALYAATTHKHDVRLSATTIFPTETGILRITPLRDKLSIDFFYSSEILSHENAIAELGRYFDEKTTKVSPVASLSPGVRLTPWKKNCIAIGSAESDFAIDFHSSLTSTVSAVIRLLDYFPAKVIEESLVDEYNRIAVGEIERLRDYQVLHYYLLNEKHSLALNRFELLPKSLAYKLDVYKASARLPWFDDEVIDMHQWISLLLGMGFWPDRYDPTLDSIPDKLLNDSVSKLELSIEKLISSMPPYRAYISQIMRTYKK